MPKDWIEMLAEIDRQKTELRNSLLIPSEYLKQEPPSDSHTNLRLSYYARWIEKLEKLY